MVISNAQILAHLGDTGRVAGTLHPKAQAILFGDVADDAIDRDLPWITQVDRAHLVMMAETGLLPIAHVSPLLRRIDEMECSGFASLRGRSAPRGVYLLYETYLIADLGEEIGGVLQTARSRNDLGATVLRMRLRQVVADLLTGLSRLQTTLLRRAEACADAVFPIYTHYQPAQPVTLAHYYAGVAGALDRDAEALHAVLTDLDRCPLGAGAVGGTGLPIDTRRTAALLGFSTPWAHSIDAVASRDAVLRLLAALGILGVTVSRLAHDLQLWTTGEFGFLTVADDLVGTSSMMPQKRNVYMLEHIKGMAAAPMGALTAAAMAMHATPFSNSIAVGTEGVKPVWAAASGMADALTLVRLIVAGAEPNQGAMRLRAISGQTNATALADWLVRERGMPFRRAHHEVGGVIRGMMVQGVVDLATAARDAHPEWFHGERSPHLKPIDVVAAQEHGGGPGPDSTIREIERVRASLRTRRAALVAQHRRWRAARQTLRSAVERVLDIAVIDRPGQGHPAGA
ncbi:argininosuccinate lyase [Azospirillum himalayense]|uniref:Argininosuccinate lyase n=1 Tax=Azospirillum himalayense TaxID=654847 RepID=A0ABW0G917_9PROT